MSATNNGSHSLYMKLCNALHPDAQQHCTKPLPDLKTLHTKTQKEKEFIYILSNNVSH